VSHISTRTSLAAAAAITFAALLASNATGGAASAAPQPTTNHCRTPDRSQVRIPGGTFLMGSTQFHEEEGPVHPATVAPFWIDRYDVTNAEFAKFVAATGYLTDAERAPDPKDYPEVPAKKLTAGAAVFTPPKDSQPPKEDLDWWHFEPHADWRRPYGAKSSIVGHDNDPVIQVSYRDALAYAHWAGRELPTEEEYEYAARGGLSGKTYAWGDELRPHGQWMANVWQGRFPSKNTAQDGYTGIAPVGCFPPNGYGLYDMVGNVWKWTSSLYSHEESGHTAASRVVRTIKGGSFLCSVDYCQRFRPAARQPQESGFSSNHLGFRTVSHRDPGAAGEVHD